MTVGLFIPCYVDQFFPHVAIATLQLLEKLGVKVVFPLKQTCCGQPMANSGFGHLTGGCDALFIKNFSGVDYIVSPSGSCVLHLKEHLHSLERQGDAAQIRASIYELSEFLTDVLKVEKVNARFAHKVGVHQSCHGQRGLHISQMSELVAAPFSKPAALLNMVEGLTIVDLARPDECCGFGGTFCVFEEAVSAKMGKDRVKDHLQNGAEFIVSADMSCLMHLQGILQRQQSTVQVKHIAEILNTEL